MYDQNPKDTPAAILIAGNTAEDVIRAVWAGKSISQLGRAKVATPVKVDDLLAALVARFDRKAERRALGAAEE